MDFYICLESMAYNSLTYSVFMAKIQFFVKFQCSPLSITMSAVINALPLFPAGCNPNLSTLLQDSVHFFQRKDKILTIMAVKPHHLLVRFQILLLHFAKQLECKQGITIREGGNCCSNKDSDILLNSLNPGYHYSEITVKS